MGDDMGVVVPLGAMFQINRVAEAERVKAQLERDVDAADSLKLRAELRLTVVLREAVKELSDAQARAALARAKLESMFPGAA